MRRNRKTVQSKDKNNAEGEKSEVVAFKPGFVVPVHPLLMIVICYGMYLTISSTLCPFTCLPSFLPLASLASSIGTSNPQLMGIKGAAAAILHLGEAAYTFHLTHYRYKFRPLTTALWTCNVLLGGIFGLWVLLFPWAFWTVAQVYCKIPASFCYNL